MREVIELAEQFIAEGNLAQAYRKYLAVKDIAASAGMAAEAQALGVKVDGLAAARLSAADRQYESAAFAAALKAYRQLATYSKIDVSLEARQRLVKSRHDPKLKAMKRDMEAAERFDRVMLILESKTAVLDPDQAVAVAATAAEQDSEVKLIAALHPADRKQVTRLLELIAKNYAGTESATRSGELLEQVSELPESALAVATNPADDPSMGECCRKMEMVELYLNSNLTGKAQGLLESVVKDYPDTGCARQAEVQLREIKLTHTVQR